jgi:hypothetical protein
MNDKYDEVTEEEFQIIAKNVGKYMNRLIDFIVDGKIIYGIVESQSGLSDWKFKIDFNDYGHITGRYWIVSENEDSNIPYYIAYNIKSVIKTVLMYREDGDKSYNRNRDEYYRKIVMAVIQNERIRRAEERTEQERERTRQAEEKTKHLQMKYKYKKRKKLIKMIEGVVICILSLLFLFGSIFYMDYKTDHDHKINNEKEVTASSKDLKGKNYKDVVEILKRDGFTNIKLEKDRDLILGWISKNGEVSSVTINGKSSFSKGDWFRKDVIIRIRYHTYKK